MLSRTVKTSLSCSPIGFVGVSDAAGFWWHDPDLVAAQPAQLRVPGG